MTQRDNAERKPRGKGPKRPRKPKVDPFSIGELEITDYKDVKMLRRFVSDTGKILPRRSHHPAEARHPRAEVTPTRTGPGFGWGFFVGVFIGAAHRATG
jgi:ribosomal protein S18